MKLLRSSGVLYIPRQWENGIRVSPKPNSPEKREPRPLKKSWRYAVFLWITGPKSWVINENTFAFSRETKWYLGKSASSGKMCFNLCNQFSSVKSLSHVWLFVTPWAAARQASLSITNSWSLLKSMSKESVMPSNYLILCHPLLSCLQGLFKWVRSLHQVAKVLEFQLQHPSSQWIFRTDFL